MYSYIVALFKLSFGTVSQVSNVAHGPLFYKEILSIYHTVGRCFILDFVEYEHSAMDPV